jgi:hypothetical protein
MRSVPIFSYNPVSLNNQLGRECVNVFPVDQNIPDYFMKDFVPDADRLIVFRKIGIRKMLANKSHQLRITVNQVGFYCFPVIVSIQIFNLLDSISLMIRTYL